MSISIQAICNKCDKKVFQPEKLTIDDHAFHKTCFTCEVCNIQLSPTDYSEKDGKYYCFKDFKAAQREIVTTNDNKTDEIEEKICYLCQQAVSSQDRIIIDNQEMIHRSCLVCSECNVQLQATNFHLVEGKIFCSQHPLKQLEGDDNGNGRKHNELMSLDADPLHATVQALELQEQKHRSSSELKQEIITSDSVSGEGKNISKNIPIEKTESQNSLPSETEKGIGASEDDKIKEDALLEPKNELSLEDNVKDSISHSESFVSEDEKIDGVGDSEKSDSDAKTGITKIPSQTTMDAGDDASSSQAAPGRRLRRSRKRKSQEDKDRKKTKKKRKSERSETEDTEDKGSEVSSKGKRRRDKTRKLKKAPSVVDVEVEDSKEEKDKDKKKKGKRGLFSLKKKGRTSSSNLKKTEEQTSGSLLFSRFRKAKKDSSESLPVKSSPKASPVPRHKYSKPTETETDSGDSEEEQLESLDELAPLGNVDKKHRLARLNRSDSKDSPKQEQNNNKVPPVIKPVSLDVPVSFHTLNSLPPCTNTLEEDISLNEVNIPEPKDNQPVLQWSSYELNRKLPLLELNLPDDIVPLPVDEKDRILQLGYFQPSVIKLGLIGVRRRMLELLAILSTTYPFEIQITGAFDASAKAQQILQERYGDTLKVISSPTELLSQDTDWIFIGSTYNNMTENILLSLTSGKNVFCEKPVCFSVEDCLKIRDVHAKSNTKFYGGFVWRLVPFYQELYDLLRSNILGDIVSVEINNLMSPSESGRLMSTWRRMRKYCCTPLFDTFCWEIDILNWLLESIPTKVGSFSGLNIFTPSNKPNTDEEMEPYLDWSSKPVEDNIPSDPFTAEKDIDDNHVIMLQYRNNVRATCHINTNSAFPQRRILICGIKGTVEGDLYTGKISYKQMNDLYETNIIQVTPGMAHGGGDQQLMEDLIDTTRNKPANIFEGEEIFPSVVTILGVEQSKKTGSIVDLEPQWKKLGL